MEKETQHLTNVESFSQLPFIRPSLLPLKEKSIRLFGKEFAADNSSTIILAADECDSITVTPVAEHSKDTGESQHRKFECHYCCRNFPTSQALGGHQNAHKRERQHAKRAHLHSTMFQGSSFNYNYTAATAQMYNVMNYHHRLAAATQIPPYYQQQQQQLQPPPPSWVTTVPINGSPLATWTARIGEGLKKPLRSENGNNSMQIRSYPYEQKSSVVADQVSLDLSL